VGDRSDEARRVEEHFQAVSRNFAFEPCYRAVPREPLKLNRQVERTDVQPETESLKLACPAAYPGTQTRKVNRSGSWVVVHHVGMKRILPNLDTL
jgi:hypothetical protein